MSGGVFWDSFHQEYLKSCGCDRSTNRGGFLVISGVMCVSEFYLNQIGFHGSGHSDQFSPVGHPKWW